MTSDTRSPFVLLISPTNRITPSAVVSNAVVPLFGFALMLERLLLPGIAVAAYAVLRPESRHNRTAEE